MPTSLDHPPRRPSPTPLQILATFKTHLMTRCITSASARNQRTRRTSKPAVSLVLCRCDNVTNKRTGNPWGVGVIGFMAHWVTVF